MINTHGEMSRGLYYNRKGEPMSTEDWARAIEDMSIRRVAETPLADGTWVSTVWLGLDHSFAVREKPLIFETMVFPSDSDMAERDMARYATEEEAIAGHAAMVAKHYTWRVQLYAWALKLKEAVIRGLAPRKS